MMSGALGRRSLLAAALGAPLAAQTRRPNIVFVLMDDVRADDLGCYGHPFVHTPHIDRLAREGALFRNAYVTTPLCSPSRACFLTGLYAHAHGIIDNTARIGQSHRLPTFPRTLQRAGYQTAFVGKWHMGDDDSPRPGFDHWVSFRGQGAYVDPEINQNGSRAKAAGYMTDILSRHAEAFLDRPHDRPFLLYIAHKAVHPDVTQFADGSLSDPSGGTFLPAERHRTLYAEKPVARRPNAMRAPAGKPALERQIGQLPPLGAHTGTDDETIRNRLRMLTAADEGLGGILRSLERSGQLDNTVLVFTSDEGYFYGEHGLSVERRLSYEESARIPLLVRYPRAVRPGTAVSGFALNIDIAPTLLELAGARSTDPMHGRSLVPLLRGSARGWRTSFLIEHASDTVFPRVRNLGYQAVRSGRWKYIRYTDLKGMDEIYDLKRDPYEMHNLMGRRPARDLSAELDRLLRMPPG